MVKLTDELTVKDYKIRNRIVLPPMQMGFTENDGSVTQKILGHYDSLSKDVGIVIVEHSYVRTNGRLSVKQLGIHNDSLTEGLSKLAATIKNNGAVAVIQINHAGSRTTKDECGEQPVAPSAVMLPGGQEIPRALEISEIDGIIEDFANAASRACKAGFDGVEVHGAHSFLLNQFASPITNKRSDKYGGTLESRMRLPLSILESVRSVIGPKMLMLYRLGADDRLPGGIDPAEGAEMARLIEDADVDILDVSGGLCGSRPEDLQSTPGFFAYLASKVKQNVSVPVIAVGGVKTPEHANDILAKNQADLVAVGRAMLKDNNWTKKALTGN